MQSRIEEQKIQKKVKEHAYLDHVGNVWVEEILPNWEKARTSTSTLDLLKQGIPVTVRGLVWQRAIGNKLQMTPDLFQIFFKQARSLRREAAQGSSAMSGDSQSDFKSPLRLIEVDVPRTFHSTGLFQVDGPYYPQLTEILETYAVYRPDVGYVQGMSYLAGMLLLYNDPYHTFQCFCNMLNNHFLLSLFKMEIKQILRHTKIYELLFSVNIPKLYEIFKELGISPEQYLLDWFLTLFSKTLPLEMASKVWDMYFLYGEVYLYQTALGILRAHRHFLMTASFEDCVMSLRHLGSRVTEEQLFKSISRISVPPYVHEFIGKVQEY